MLLPLLVANLAALVETPDGLPPMVTFEPLLALRRNAQIGERWLIQSARASVMIQGARAPSMPEAAPRCSWAHNGPGGLTDQDRRSGRFRTAGPATRPAIRGRDSRGPNYLDQPGHGTRLRFRGPFMARTRPNPSSMGLIGGSGIRSLCHSSSTNTTIPMAARRAIEGSATAQ